MLEICKKLFTVWNSNCVKYCHWKSNEHLMEGLDGLTDLDVFVHPVHRELAVAILVQTGYLKCKTQVSARYPNVEEWIGFDYQTGKLVHIHLHFQIITGTKFCKEYVFPIDDFIINTRVQDTGTEVYVTNPNLEIIILLSRIVLKATDKKHVKVSKDYVKEQEYLKERLDSNVLKGYCKELIPNQGDTFANYAMSENLTQEDFRDIDNIVEEWLRPYRKYSRLHVYLRHHYFLLKSSIDQILNKKFGYHIITKKTFPGVNMSICFIGQDGSGKSTITQEICKWLNWKIAAERFYLGSGDHYNSLLKRVLEESIHKTSSMEEAKLIEKPAKTDKKKDRDNRRKRSFYKTVAGWGWSVLRVKYLSGIAHRTYRKIETSVSYMKSGGIALYDRFPQIQFSGLYDGPKIRAQFLEKGEDNAIVRYFAKRELYWLTKAQNIQPSIVFKLKLSPEESIRRKPFEDYDAICKKAIITEQLTFGNSIVYDIDANQNYDAELIQVKRLIWKNLLKNANN